MGKWKHRLSDICDTGKTATCAHCGPVAVKRCSSGWRCRNVVREESKRETPRPYKYPHGDRPIAICPICQKEKALVYDHCHTTNAFRNWICRECNSGLGLFYDDPTALRTAATYIEQHRTPEEA